MEIENIGNFKMVKEDHLGGFLIEKDPATYMPHLWSYMIDKFKPESVVDVGCGMGYFVQHVKDKVKKVIGIDGSEYVKNYSRVKDDIIKHDFTTGKLDLNQNFDLCWSCEFVEHVDEKYLDNFMDIFKKSKYVAITYAGLGQDGHNHVNCKNIEYWIETFNKNGFTFEPEITNELKEVTKTDANTINPLYKDNHFLLRGLFFKNNLFK